MAAIALSFWMLFSFADDKAVIAEFLGDATGELSNGNQRGFLKRFDREMPGYGELESEVGSLLKVAEVASSAQVLEQKSTGAGWLVTVDWFIELKPHGQQFASERRRELVQVRLAKFGKTWKIRSLEPQSLFRAPRL